MKSAALLTFLLSPAALAAELVQVMPAPFIGEWNARLADCGTHNNDSALEIKPDRISYYESAGSIKAIVTQGRHEVALIAELSGEGQSWLATDRFKLSPQGDQLTSVDIPGQAFVRYRCAFGRDQPSAAPNNGLLTHTNSAFPDT